MKPVRVLFLLPYPLGRAPSQRFRVENLLPLLDEAGIQYTLKPFMTEATWNVLYKGGSMLQKGLGILKGYAKRAATVLFGTSGYDYVFIHREAAPLGPPLFEWWLKKVGRRKIIFDFDDAIWIPNTTAENKLAGLLKAFWKVPLICKLSYKISAGNDYLKAFASAHSGAEVLCIPTVVDTEHRYNILKEHHEGKLVLGWTGSHSTLKYLDEVMPVLQSLQEEVDFTFLVIADKKPELPLRDWVFMPWNATSEIADLLKMDVGLMPLTADPWSEGKCGFKLIQYLALGIPAVASPVGVNSAIVEQGRNGFLAATEIDWKAHLRDLLTHVSLREKMGKEGREKIVQEYSIAAIQGRFLGIFRDDALHHP